MRARLTKDFTFEAAHTLPEVAPNHKCARMHGHSFKVEISIEGEINPVAGWVQDHSEISRVVDLLMEQLDHRYLNEIVGLENPTFENIAVWIWRRLKVDLPDLVEITIHETPTARCTYRGE